MTPFLTSDGLVYLENLPPRALQATAIARSLAKINRFAGRTPVPWSVAAHSVLVSRLCPYKEERAWGLLHDAHEAFIGDLTSPGATFIAGQSRPVAGHIVENSIDRAKAVLDRQIRQAWNIDRFANAKTVADFDRIAVEAEMFHFFGVELGFRSTEHDHAQDILHSLTASSDWQVAADLWLLEAAELQEIGALHDPCSPVSQFSPASSDAINQPIGV